jgi:hypothetical protein
MIARSTRTAAQAAAAPTTAIVITTGVAAAHGPETEVTMMRERSAAVQGTSGKAPMGTIRTVITTSVWASVIAPVGSAI